jgi:UDP-3-O-[3-hydroxymyristoyl] glucosamine N-acyltransferase
VEKRLGELAQLVGGKAIGDSDTIVCGVASIEDAVPGDIVFAESERHLARAVESAAAAIILGEGAAGYSNRKPAIEAGNPRLAFAKIIDVFAPAVAAWRGVDASAAVDDSACIGEDVGIGPFAYVGAGAVIGDRTSLFPFVYVAAGARIGADSVVFPHVTVLDGVVIGERARIHSGAVIGSDGFGFVCVDGQHHKVPQIGGVRIGDDVEIGANVTIDRARTGNTEIGTGTKIDNLVHVAHNVKIGRNCVIVALSGIAGSSEVCDGAIIAGQAGVKDHVRIGAGAKVTARAGVIGDIPDGATVAGFPGRPYAEYMKSKAALGRLPDLLKKVRDLEARITRLERPLHDERTHDA